jgi:hypothetical protein
MGEKKSLGITLNTHNFAIAQGQTIQDKKQENQDYQHPFVSYRSLQGLCTEEIASLHITLHYS